MIQWVYERAIRANLVDRVIIATDYEQIHSTVINFGGESILTNPDLPSGTDRVAAAVSDLSADVIINLQGDEPFISSELLSDMTKPFSNSDISIATPIKKIQLFEELDDPNLVRVVKDKNNYALYFTRSVIPHIRGIEKKYWLNDFTFYKHIGIYAYRKNILEEITNLPESSLEKAERLEQLRFLENGYKIYTVETTYNSISIDTPEDLLNVNDKINTGQININ